MKKLNRNEDEEVILLVARPSCSVVNILLYRRSILFKPNEDERLDLIGFNTAKPLRNLSRQNYIVDELHTKDHA